MKRFWDKVEKTDACWNWTAGGRGKGYGGFKYKSKIIDAHRFVWFLTYGKFPVNWVLHHCDNRRCVNPSHLYEGTPKSNTRDAMERGKQFVFPHRSGEQMYQAKLNEIKVLDIRRKYLKNIYGVRRLAKDYGVHFSTIQKIIKRISWKHI